MKVHSAEWELQQAEEREKEIGVSEEEMTSRYRKLQDREGSCQCWSDSRDDVPLWQGDFPLCGRVMTLLVVGCGCWGDVPLWWQGDVPLLWHDGVVRVMSPCGGRVMSPCGGGMGWSG